MSHAHCDDVIKIKESGRCDVMAQSCKCGTQTSFTCIDCNVQTEEQISTRGEKRRLIAVSAGFGTEEQFPNEKI